MDVTLEFDSKQRLVVVTVTGVLTDQDLLEGYDQMVADPRFRSDYHQLVDLRGATGEAVTAQGVRALVGRDPEFAPTSRRAIVIRSQLGFGMARMYEILRGGEAGE